MFPYWNVHHDICEEAVRASLGEDRVPHCWEQGYAMGWGQATAAALEERGLCRAACPPVLRGT